jgi:hypothetical protein
LATRHRSLSAQSVVLWRGKIVLDGVSESWTTGASRSHQVGGLADLCDHPLGVGGGQLRERPNSPQAPPPAGGVVSFIVLAGRRAHPAWVKRTAPLLPTSRAVQQLQGAHLGTLTGAGSGHRGPLRGRGLRDRGKPVSARGAAPCLGSDRGCGH